MRRDGQRERSDTGAAKTVSLLRTVWALVHQIKSSPSQLEEQSVRPSELKERERTGAE